MTNLYIHDQITPHTLPTPPQEVMVSQIVQAFCEVTQSLNAVALNSCWLAFPKNGDSPPPQAVPEIVHNKR